jgi:hypothetical protein
MRKEAAERRHRLCQLVRDYEAELAAINPAEMPEHPQGRDDQL